MKEAILDGRQPEGSSLPAVIEPHLVDWPRQAFGMLVTGPRP